jgi:ubiquinone/menaquinone biosynthesis C-methylase UbiE
MSDYTNKSPLAKRHFYAQPEIAKGYDEQRFGSASGAWVSNREIEIALRLATPFRCALDLGCGTGRLMRALAPNGKTVGVDTSLAMLEQSRSLATPGQSFKLAQADAFSLPFADASFDALIALRFIFHFENLENLFREIARVLTPRGIFVFDTFTWSPRAWLPLDSARWGGSVYDHSARQVELIARRAGLQVVDRERAFLFSPYIYRLLPPPIVKLLGRIETRVPSRFRSRVFWKLARNE